MASTSATDTVSATSIAYAAMVARVPPVVAAAPATSMIATIAGIRGTAFAILHYCNSSCNLNSCGRIRDLGILCKGGNILDERALSDLIM